MSTMSTSCCWTTTCEVTMRDNNHSHKLVSCSAKLAYSSQLVMSTIFLRRATMPNVSVLALQVGIIIPLLLMLWQIQFPFYESFIGGRLIQMIQIEWTWTIGKNEVGSTGKNEQQTVQCEVMSMRQAPSTWHLLLWAFAYRMDWMWIAMSCHHPLSPMSMHNSMP